MMKRLGLMMCVAACVAAVAGCVPERVAWSPDGMRAAIIGEDGVHLCDVAGRLGPVVVPVAQSNDSKAVAWMPDGKGMIILHDEKLTTWKEVEAAFPARAKALAADKERIGKAREKLLAAAGRSQEDFDKVIQPANDGPREDGWALIYLRDTEGNALRGKLGDHWQALGDFADPGEVIQLYRLQGDKAVAGPVLWHAAPTLVSLRVSSTGRAVAIAEANNEHDATLTVAATDGSGNVRTLGSSALYPDWSVDGKSILYIKPLGPVGEHKDDVRLGSLVRLEVLNSTGVIPADLSQGPTEEMLAGFLFDVGSRVRTAADGRIFFVSAEVTLPTTPLDVNPKATLFSIAPDKQTTVTHVVPKGSQGEIGDAPQFFEMSPNGRYISVPFQDGRVSVLNTATGQVELVQPLEVGAANSGDRLTTVPVWRPGVEDGELTFLQPKKAGGPAAEVVRYSMADKKRMVISDSWPAAMRWFGEKGTSTGPASQP